MFLRAQQPTNLPAGFSASAVPAAIAAVATAATAAAAAAAPPPPTMAAASTIHASGSRPAALRTQLQVA